MPKRFQSTVVLLTLVLAATVGSASDDPFVIAEIEGSADGVAGRKIVQAAYDELGINVTFRALPAAEALRQSNAGEADAELQRINGITDRFANLVQVPIPINVIYGVAFSVDYRFPVDGWHSLRPYRIGIVRGILFSEEQTRHMEVQVAENYEELFRLLHAGEVDVVVVPRIQALAHLRRTGDDRVVQMDGVLEMLFLYHYVHRDHADLVPGLTAAFKRLLQSGETRRVHQAAQPPDPTPP